MVRAAKLYHDLDRTQSEIAKELGLTRWQIGRLLSDARAHGVVRVDIVPRSPRCPNLESELQRRYKLREAVVVPVTLENEGIILDSIALAGAQDPVISTVLALAEKVTIVCFTMEALSEQSVHVESGHLTKREVAALRKKGAIGDILGRFIDIDGEIADREIDARTVGLDPAMLRRKEYSICIADGESKHRVILAGLRAGYFNVLITEEKAASYLLQNG